MPLAQLCSNSMLCPSILLPRQAVQGASCTHQHILAAELAFKLPAAAELAQLQ